jgi:hypothetical protein
MRWNAQQLGRAHALASAVQLSAASVKESAFAAFEEFHLPEPLFRFFPGLVGTAEIFLAVLGKNFITARNLFDHRLPLKLDARTEAKSCGGLTASLDNAARAP